MVTTLIKGRIRCWPSLMRLWWDLGDCSHELHSPLSLPCTEPEGPPRAKRLVETVTYLCLGLWIGSATGASWLTTPLSCQLPSWYTGRFPWWSPAQSGSNSRVSLMGFPSCMATPASNWHSARYESSMETVFWVWEVWRQCFEQSALQTWSKYYPAAHKTKLPSLAFSNSR